MCRFVQNGVEQAAWPRESDSLAGCLSPIRPATTNGGRAAEAALPVRPGDGQYGPVTIICDRGGSIGMRYCSLELLRCTVSALEFKLAQHREAQ
jgi:hypothetical protein